MSSLVSFILPSYMVAPKRIPVNTLFPFDINTRTSLQESSSGMTNNMEVDILEVSLLFLVLIVLSYLQCFQMHPLKYMWNAFKLSTTVLHKLIRLKMKDSKPLLSLMLQLKERRIILLTRC